jgi:shikimate dehydrogenase
LGFAPSAAVTYKQRVSEPSRQAIDARTRYCAVLGCPIAHSASPAMQNAGVAALGLNWRYLAFEVWPEDLALAIQGAKVMKFIGLNLTVPHKLLALEMMDVLDDSAKVWGAVNTVRFEGREEGGDWRPLHELAQAPREIRTHGFNTDADAITHSLREDLGVNVAGARVLLLGAGGAGRTAALKFASEKAGEIFLVNRTASKAQELAREIGERHPTVKAQAGYPAGSVDLVLNATSLGLKPEDPLPFDEGRFSLRQTGAVYDMVYRPVETALLKAAKKVGCRAANGMGMLLHQGAKALELWSGREAPRQVMRAALAEALVR